MTPSLETWHCRLGHVNYATIVDMAQKGLVTGMCINMSTLPPICRHCILGKQTKKAVPKTRQGQRAGGILDIMYSDLTGPEEVASAGGAKYIMILIDNHSSMTWIYLLKEKSQAKDAFIEWWALVENETGRKVGHLRTDVGGEYMSAKFERYLQKQGSEHQLTAPYTSAQNG